MLKGFVECKVQANFFIIEDTEDVRGQDLFIAFLKNCERDNSINQINLICYENPPEFYFPNKQFKSDKVIFHDFFSDPCGWNNPPAPRQDLNLFTSDAATSTGIAVFIDSLSLLAYHQGFFTTCRNLRCLKKYSKVFCFVHGDLFSMEQLEDLSSFASVYIKLLGFSAGECSVETICAVTYKKPGGKIIKQKELFVISDDFRVSSRIAETKALSSSDVMVDIENLSTFKLGLNISEKERKARDELVLPYLKIGNSSQTGEIIYQPEADDFEDDPDDDLDI